LVQTGNDGYKAVAYNNVSALLVEAVKDQQTIIDRQTATIQEQNDAFKLQQKDLDEYRSRLESQQQQIFDLTKKVERLMNNNVR
jgi:hypothetical protein